MQEIHNYGKKSFKKKGIQMKCCETINNQIVLPRLTQTDLERANYIEPNRINKT